MEQNIVSFLKSEGMQVELDEKRIGKRFRSVRKQAELTQELFGEALDLSKNHISDIERGCSLPTVKVLINIYTQFGHTTDEVLFGSKGLAYREEHGAEQHKQQVHKGSGQNVDHMPGDPRSVPGMYEVQRCTRG